MSALQAPISTADMAVFLSQFNEAVESECNRAALYTPAPENLLVYTEVRFHNALGRPASMGTRWGKLLVLPVLDALHGYTGTQPWYVAVKREGMTTKQDFYRTLAEEFALRQFSGWRAERVEVLVDPALESVPYVGYVNTALPFGDMSVEVSYTPTHLNSPRMRFIPLYGAGTVFPARPRFVRREGEW